MNTTGPKDSPACSGAAPTASNPATRQMTDTFPRTPPSRKSTQQYQREFTTGKSKRNLSRATNATRTRFLQSDGAIEAVRPPLLSSGSVSMQWPHPAGAPTRGTQYRLQNPRQAKETADTTNHGSRPQVGK